MKRSNPTTAAACPDAPRRIGLIGAGRIAMPIIDAWTAGGLPGWTISGVLARGERELGPLRSTGNAEKFFLAGHDLIIEAAGPAALAAHGERALDVADVWTVSAAALADAMLFGKLEAAARQAGHRLRVMPGAFAGLDGVATAAVDLQATLQLDIDLPPGKGQRQLRFSGTAREAALRYPGSANVAAAAALAGPGLDKSRVDVSHPGPTPQYHLALTATSRYGTVRVAVSPRVGPGIHPVAANLIAMLRREMLAVWVG